MHVQVSAASVAAAVAWIMHTHRAAAHCKQHANMHARLRLQDKMGLRETRLLDEVAVLRQQLAEEKAAR